MNTLVFPLPVLRRLLDRLTESPRSTVLLPVGISRTSETAYLAQDVVSAEQSNRLPDKQPVFMVNTTDVPVAALAMAPFSWPAIGCLWLGQGALQGQAWGTVCQEEIMEPLHCLSLVGEGMQRMPLTMARGTDFGEHTNDSDRWSRTIGALGGQEIWERLVSLAIVVVGCGRTGSMVAETLAKSGVAHLTLIDPDVIENHNLGEMNLVDGADLGRLKVAAIAEHLAKYAAHDELSEFSVTASPIRRIATSVTSESAMLAMKNAEVILCCVDDDAARLLSAIMATLYHKVLVDIGTGIFFRSASEATGVRQSRSTPATPSPVPRTMGADVRLILPGDGCLLCHGNLVGYAQAVTDLCNHRTPASLQRDWREQRAGSLRTLNQIAAAIGVQMLQDLILHRIRTSTWAHVEVDDTGRMTVAYPSPPQRGTSCCVLCTKAGLGDHGFGF